MTNLTPEKEQQYREEFEKEWNFVDLRKLGDAYVDDKVNMMWEVYKDAKAKIDKQADFFTVERERLNKEIEQLKEKLKRKQEEIDKLKLSPIFVAVIEKEIAQLKEELKRERSIVDEFISAFARAGIDSKSKNPFGGLVGIAQEVQSKRSEI